MRVPLVQAREQLQRDIIGANVVRPSRGPVHAFSKVTGFSNTDPDTRSISIR